MTRRLGSSTIQVKHNTSYIEFLMASINKSEATSKDNLKKAFDMFDKVLLSWQNVQDHSGSITTGELKAILGTGQKFSEDVWKDILKEVDANGDGQISYQEFEEMMQKFNAPPAK